MVGRPQPAAGKRIAASRLSAVFGIELEARARPASAPSRLAPLGRDVIALPAELQAQWPYRPRFAPVNGWRMHYVDEGAGDPVVLLHGNPAWGFLYRDFVAPLTEAGRRVMMPDMIGFGLSEKPARELRTAWTPTSPTSRPCCAGSTSRGRPSSVTTGRAHRARLPLSNAGRVRALALMSVGVAAPRPASFTRGSSPGA